ncbi:hypothetical protein GCM10011506_08830 [Marivirga lumbricoides]|nr:hypothetical protein GCM10011506_08830 [Marivirga lumbricoides]
MFMSCTQDDDSSQTKTLEYADFELKLNLEMTYNSLLEEFGEPSKDIGSGIHIYVYQLVDDTEIWIGYTNKIEYARHMDKDQQIIKEII